MTDWIAISACATIAFTVVSIVILGFSIYQNKQSIKQNKETLEYAKSAIFIEKEINCTSIMNKFYFHIVDDLKSSLEELEKIQQRYDDTEIKKDFKLFDTKYEKMIEPAFIGEILVEYRPFLSHDVCSEYEELCNNILIASDSYHNYLLDIDNKFKALSIELDEISKESEDPKVVSIAFEEKMKQFFIIDINNVKAIENKLDDAFDNCMENVSEYIRTMRKI